MGRFVLILFLFSLLGVFYSFIINKFSHKKILLFLPSILGALWIPYKIILTRMKPAEGFTDIGVMLIIIIVFTFIIGNILSGIYLIYRNKKRI